jgi:hypothetical protein
MIRDGVRSFCSLTVSSSSTAVLPVAVPRGSGSFARGWLHARGRRKSSESQSRSNCLEGIRVAYFLALFACASLFGLAVGGYVGYMENATPHGGTPGSLARLATSDGQWVAMMRQSRAASGGRLRSMAESQGVSFLAACRSRAMGEAEDLVSAAPVFSTLVCAGSHPASVKGDRQDPAGGGTKIVVTK